MTYNRKELLGRCLDAVLAQTRRCDHIFVIDNASTDGTNTLLAEKATANQSIEHVRLPANTGSAGGFHEGMKRAHRAGYRWIWVMDDDGRPAPNCLESLLSCPTALDVIGPAVVRPDDPSRLTWSVRKVGPDGRFRTLRSIYTHRDLLDAAIDGVYEGFAALFNGVLINARVPETIGYVLADLFIWGDENEYMLRCKTAGFRIGMYPAALHFHPYVKPRRSTTWKFFYLCRNTMFIHWRYGGTMLPPVRRLLYPPYISLRLLADLPSLSPPYLLDVARASWSALQGRLVPAPRLAA